MGWKRRPLSKKVKILPYKVINKCAAGDERIVAHREKCKAVMIYGIKRIYIAC